MKKTNGLINDVEFFDHKSKWLGNERISISKNDMISFNAAFSRKTKLNEKTHVRLGYSPKARIIIFDFTEDPKAPGAYALIGKGTSNFSIACRSFFRAYDFDLDEIAGRYIPRRQRIPKVGECWLINLGEKVEK